MFDTGPLSHFAQAGWLGLLRESVGSTEAWIPAAVQREISDGLMHYSHLRSVLDAGWLVRHEAVSTAEHAAPGRYTARLLGDDQRKNLGECEVLALAEVHRGVAVIDDSFARTVANEFRVSVRSTVSLLCDLVRDERLSLDFASTIADRLLETEYRLPFGPDGFRMFAIENDLLPYG